MSLVISADMLRALRLARADEGQGLRRHTGGFWGTELGWEEEHVGTRTVRALVARELMKFWRYEIEWGREEGPRSIPIAAQLTAKGKAFIDKAEPPARALPWGRKS